VCVVFLVIQFGAFVKALYLSSIAEVVTFKGVKELYDLNGELFLIWDKNALQTSALSWGYLVDRSFNFSCNNLSNFNCNSI